MLNEGKIICALFETTIQGDKRIGCCGICKNGDHINSVCKIADQVKEWMKQIKFEGDASAEKDG